MRRSEPVSPNVVGEIEEFVAPLLEQRRDDVALAVVGSTREFSPSNLRSATLTVRSSMLQCPGQLGEEAERGGEEFLAPTVG